MPEIPQNETSFASFKIPSGTPTWAVGIGVLITLLFTGGIAFYKVAEAGWERYNDRQAKILQAETEVKAKSLAIDAQKVDKTFEAKDKEMNFLFEMIKAQNLQITANATQINNQSETLSELKNKVTQSEQAVSALRNNFDECEKTLKDTQQKLIECQASKKGK